MKHLAWLLGCTLTVSCAGQLGESDGPSEEDESTAEAPDESADDDPSDGPDDQDPSGDGDAGPSKPDLDDPDPGDPDSDDPDASEPDGPDAGTLDPEPDPGDPTFPGPLSECPSDPSIDRFESWLASGEGSTTPATGSILAKEGDDYIARIRFNNQEWHVVPVLTANRFDGGEANFSAATGFWLTYSATDALYVQLRPAFAWDGGAKYLTLIPSTAGAVQTRFFSFAREHWTTLDALGTPPYSYESTLEAVRGFVFVGETPNEITFHGLRVDGYEPPCL